MADDDDRRRIDPSTVPERLPGSGPPELPGSATKFVVTVMVIGVLLAFAILVVIATTSGGSDGKRPGEAAPAATSSQSGDVSGPAGTPAPDSPPPDTPGTEDTTAEGEDEGGLELEDITHVTVPDVVGTDLQSAQELLFPGLRTTSVDATGQDRMQLVDSNWTVVRTDPPAAALVPRFTDVTLYVVKPGEIAVL